jgi:hypothetical protein
VKGKRFPAAVFCNKIDFTIEFPQGFDLCDYTGPEKEVKPSLPKNVRCTYPLAGKKRVMIIL